MNTYRVYSRGEERQVQAVGHREAARKCGPVSPGEALWVDGPVDENAADKATIHFTVTAHNPPHLRQGLTYRYA
jgi:hypothetical protein